MSNFYKIRCPNKRCPSRLNMDAWTQAWDSPELCTEYPYHYISCMGCNLSGPWHKDADKALSEWYRLSKLFESLSDEEQIALEQSSGLLEELK